MTSPRAKGTLAAAIAIPRPTLRTIPRAIGSNEYVIASAEEELEATSEKFLGSFFFFSLGEN